MMVTAASRGARSIEEMVDPPHEFNSYSRSTFRSLHSYSAWGVKTRLLVFVGTRWSELVEIGPAGLSAHIALHAGPRTNLREASKIFLIFSMALVSELRPPG